MNHSRTFKFLLAAALAVAFSAGAYAQATRTWVSGVGDDANPCSRTAPCKTFAGAISKTAAAGEINVLDPGGFGAVTVTKSITISSECVEAGVLVCGTNGIIVNTPNTTDFVVLRGLDIEGLGTGLNGITFIQKGSLQVEKCTINRFTQSGINFAPNSGTATLHVLQTNTRNCNVGTTTFGGILVKPTAGSSANVDVNGSHFANNGNGVFGDGTGGGAFINVNVRDSVVTNSSNSGIVASTGGATIKMTVDSTMVVYSTNTGVASNGAATTVRIGSSTISNNVTGVVALGGSTMQSFKNNQIASNSTDGTPIPAVPGGPLN